MSVSGPLRMVGMQVLGGITMHLLLLLLSIAPLLTAAQQAVKQVVSVRTGQELADAVADWGASGSNTIIQIDAPFISVRTATFQTEEAIAARTGTEPFSRGKLIIRGQVNSDGSPATVLDAGMRENLTRLSQAAQMDVSNIIMVNLCEEGSSIPVVQYSYPWRVRLFAASQVLSARTFKNVWLYGPQPALELAMHYFLMQRVPIPRVRELTLMSAGLSGLSAEPTLLSEHVAGVKTLNLVDASFMNAYIKAVENTDDLLVAQWKAGGVLMRPQLCNGGPVVDQATQRLLTPIWVSEAQSALAPKLAQAAAYTAVPRLVKALPVVLLLGRESVTVPDTSTYQVSGRLLLISTQFGYLPSWDLLLNVNLNQRVNLFNIAPGADVIIQWLGLAGLAVQVPTRLPPSLAGRSPDSLLPSVFPLAAFNASAGPDTWNRTVQVMLINSTLAIPPDDYLALFILTSKQGKAGVPSCADPSLNQRVDQLQAGISTWAGSSASDTSLEQHMQQQQPQLFVSTFQGWGFNATQLRLVPTGPLVMPSCSSSQQSGLTKPQVVGLAVGLACGLVVLLAALVALLLWVRRRRHGSSASSQVSTNNSHPGSKVQSIEFIKAGSTGAARHTPLSSMLNSSSVVPSTVPGQHSSASCPASFVQIVQRAQETQAQVFASLVSRPDGSSGQASTGEGSKPSTQGDDPRTRGVDKRQMYGQIQELAAKLQKEGDELILAGVLGAGGAGTVYMGLWRGLRVAVKTVIFHEAPSTQAQVKATKSQQAVLEAAICASLGHRNVVATYQYDIKALQAHGDSQTTGGLQIDMTPATQTADQHAYKLFLVQELCNTSLSEAVHNGLLQQPGSGLLDLQSMILVLLDIASGLEYLHCKGIIHGDLKPENVLLKVDASNPEEVVAKLADFGLSTKLQPGDTHVSNYKNGTPFYVAPEVALNHQVSPASDLYSFGVMCWELFTQQKPYLHLPGGGFAWRAEFPDYPSSCGVPLPLLQMSHGCLQHDPQMRPSASEAAQILRGVMMMGIT